MKAIAYYNSLPINDPQSLQDIELPAPVAGPRDLLVEVTITVPESLTEAQEKAMRDFAEASGLKF